MDIQLKPKKGLRRKHVPWLAGGALLAALIGWILFGTHRSVLKVDRRTLNITEVRKARFDDFVRIEGQVAPISVVQVSPEEGGIVTEKVVEEGAKVRAGDVLVRLTNSNLDLQILNAEAELAEKYRCTPRQLALNWLISQPGVVAIVKAADPLHLAENVGAAGWRMEPEDIERLRREYPGCRAVSEAVPLI